MFAEFTAPFVDPASGQTVTRTFYNTTAEELVAAGIQASIIQTAMAGARLKEIKAECKRRIYARASAETQMNMTAAAAVVGAKPASSRSAAENAILAGHASALQWVADMRENCSTLAADLDSDFRADASWPEPSPEASALVAQF